MADDWDRYLAEQAGGWAGGPVDWVKDFGRSALEAIPELVGITPSQETLRFRANNPWAGFGSELLGMAVPYGAWLKGTRMAAGTTRAGAMLEAAATGGEGYATRLAANPFLTGARAEAVRLAPFEAGRLAASQVVGDKSFGEMAFETSLNLVGGAAIAGGLAKVGTLGKRPVPLREAIPGIDDSQAPQLLLRQINEKAVADPAVAVEAANWRPRLEEAARSEVVPKGSVYVHPQVAGPEDELERLFQPGRTGKRDVDTLRPVASEAATDFVTEADWQGVFAKAGIAPQDVAEKMQFPRVLQVNPAYEAQRAQKGGGTLKPGDLLKPQADAEWLETSLMKNLTPIGDGWLLAREPQDGLFVMAKKVDGVPLAPGTATWKGLPKVPRSSPTDQWILFKTDQPGAFAKEQQEFLNASVARERWLAGRPAVEDLVKGTGPVGLLAKFVVEDAPIQRYTELAARVGTENVPRVIDKVWKPLSQSAVAQATGGLIRAYLAPAAHQFKGNPVANYVFNAGQLLQDGADMFYRGLFGGAKAAQEDKSLLRGFTTLEGKTDLETLWGQVDKEGHLKELLELRRQQASAAEAAAMARAGEITPRTAELAKQIEDTLAAAHAERQKAAIAAGGKRQEFVPGTYGLPIRWEGDYMKVVRDEGGAIRGVAAGGSPRAAGQNAEKLAGQLAARTGAKYRAAEAFQMSGDPAGLPKDVARVMANPAKVVGEKGIRGFRWDLEEPTLAQVLDDVKAWTEGEGRQLGKDLREALLSPHLSRLASEAPEDARNLVKRFELMAGKEGEFARVQNRLADKALSPYGFGTNTASKLAAINNTTLTHQALGAFKLSAPLQNVLGVFQTVLPETAFLMNGGDAARIRNYGITAPAMGASGPVGSVSALDPFKALWQGFRAAAKPDAELRGFYNRAINDRILDSQAAENYIGQNRRTLREWRGAIDSPKALGQFLLAMSEWLLLHSDRFARTLAFTTAVQIQRNWHGVADPELVYQTAKRLTERTNYNYSSAARPLVFTGPVGSSLGLFKNWQMNFIANMVEYANFGLNRGVWSPLIWQTMTTAALGGLAATPLYWAANAAANFFAQKRLVQYAYDEWGSGADAVMFGLPAALTGVSLSSLMTSPGANPVKDATQLFDFAIWQRMKDAGGLVHAAMDNWRATGQHPASDPDVRNNLAKAFAPVLLQRAMALDWESGQVRSLASGLPSTKGLSVFDMLAYQAGLQPTTIERQMAATNILYEDKQKMASATRAFGDALAEALDARDSQAANAVLLRATAQGVDLSRVMQSATSRLRMGQETSAERLARPEALQQVRGLLGY